MNPIEMTMDEGERDHLLKLFNQRVSEVQATESILATPLSASPNEEFRSASLRSACERMYLACAKCYGPAVARLKLTSSWQDPTRSASWLTLYTVLFYYNVLAASILASMATGLLRPEWFDAPMFGPLRSAKVQTFDAAEATADAEAIRDAIMPGEMEPQSPFASPVDEPVALPDSPPAGKPLPLGKRVGRALGPIQIHLGGLADQHERLYNLAQHRSPPQTRYAAAWILVSSACAVSVLPLWLLAKSFWLCLGCAIFIVPPIRQRFPRLEEAIQERLRLFREVPTNTQLTYNDLLRDPALCDRIQTVRAVAKPAADGEEPAPPGKRQRLAQLVKSGLDFAERSSEYVSGQRELNVRDQLLQLTGLAGSISAAEEQSFSFFASYRGMPGHLVIPPRSDTPGVLRFRSGIAITTIGKTRTERLAWPMADIRIIRKVGGLNLAGLGLSHLGIGLDDMAVGLELVDSAGVVYRFDRCFRRDTAFARCLLAVEGVWQCS